jgi:iron-sulfur cluster insertion protein
MTMTDALENPSLTAAAAARIRALRLEQAADDLNLRLSVSGGGCQGFQYHFALEGGAAASDDQEFANGDACLRVDETSLGLLGGAVIDYQESLMQAGFVVTNPNASSRCGCGSSFSI